MHRLIARNAHLKLITGNEEISVAEAIKVGILEAVDYTIRKGEFKLWCDGTLFKGTIGPTFGPYLNKLLHQEVEVQGTIEDNKIVKVNCMVSKDTPAPNFRQHLEDIKVLERGWCDGEGKEFSADFVDQVGSIIVDLIESGLPAPFAFPRDDGSIHLEWTIGSWEVRIDFFSDGNANYYGWSGDEIEDEDFSVPEGVKSLRQKIAKRYNELKQTSHSEGSK